MNSSTFSILSKHHPHPLPSAHSTLLAAQHLLNWLSDNQLHKLCESFLFYCWRRSQCQPKASPPFLNYQLSVGPPMRTSCLSKYRSVSHIIFITICLSRFSLLCYINYALSFSLLFHLQFFLLSSLFQCFSHSIPFLSLYFLRRPIMDPSIVKSFKSYACKLFHSLSCFLSSSCI